MQGIGDDQVTPQEMLDVAARDFEMTFKNVCDGPAQSTFVHDGDRLEYIEVVGGGPILEGQMIPVYDTPEEAVAAWRKTVRDYEGKEFLYWRIRPEIGQDTNEKMFWMDAVSPPPNPSFGKWKTYSRFKAVS